MNLIRFSSLALVLAACGGSNPEPAGPATTTPMATTTTASPATATASAAPTGTQAVAPAATPNGAATPDCGPPPSTAAATSLASCLSTCETLADKVPEGAKCIPPRTSCQMSCKQKFPK